MRRAGATSSLLLLGIETAIVFGTPVADRLDRAILVRGAGPVLADPDLRVVALQLTRIGDPPKFAALALIVVGGAWLARGRPTAQRCVAVVVGANLTTQLLQPLLDGLRDDSYTYGMAFVYPSGHTTAIASLAVCLPLLFAGVTRTLAAAVAAGLVVAISSGLVLGGTHLLSDVVAALLIVAGWSFAVGPEPALRPEPRMRVVSSAMAAVAGGGLVALGGLGGIRAIGTLWSQKPALAAALGGGVLAAAAGGGLLAACLDRRDPEAIA